VLADARLAQYANGETCVPVVLVASDEFSRFRAIIIFDDLGTYVIQFHVLQVGAYKHTEVERAQIGIRPILHGTLLSLQANGREEKE
jgi:hypothetical protein